MRRKYSRADLAQAHRDGVVKHYNKKTTLNHLKEEACAGAATRATLKRASAQHAAQVPHQNILALLSAAIVGLTEKAAQHDFEIKALQAGVAELHTSISTTISTVTSDSGFDPYVDGLSRDEWLRFF